MSVGVKVSGEESWPPRRTWQCHPSTGLVSTVLMKVQQELHVRYHAQTLTLAETSSHPRKIVLKGESWDPWPEQEHFRIRFTRRVHTVSWCGHFARFRGLQPTGLTLDWCGAVQSGARTCRHASARATQHQRLWLSPVRLLQPTPPATGEPAATADSPCLHC